MARYTFIPKLSKLINKPDIKQELDDQEKDQITQIIIEMAGPELTQGLKEFEISDNTFKSGISKLLGEHNWNLIKKSRGAFHQFLVGLGIKSKVEEEKYEGELTLENLNNLKKILGEIENKIKKRILSKKKSYNNLLDFLTVNEFSCPPYLLSKLCKVFSPLVTANMIPGSSRKYLDRLVQEPSFQLTIDSTKPIPDTDLSVNKIQLHENTNFNKNIFSGNLESVQEPTQRVTKKIRIDFDREMEASSVYNKSASEENFSTKKKSSKNLNAIINKSCPLAANNPLEEINKLAQEQNFIGNQYNLGFVNNLNGILFPRVSQSNTSQIPLSNYVNTFNYGNEKHRFFSTYSPTIPIQQLLTPTSETNYIKQIPPENYHNMFFSTPSTPRERQAPRSSAPGFIQPAESPSRFFSISQASNDVKNQPYFSVPSTPQHPQQSEEKQVSRMSIPAFVQPMESTRGLPSMPKQFQIQSLLTPTSENNYIKQIPSENYDNMFFSIPSTPKPTEKKPKSQLPELIYAQQGNSLNRFFSMSPQSNNFKSQSQQYFSSPDYQQL